MVTCMKDLRITITRSLMIIFYGSTKADVIVVDYDNDTVIAYYGLIKVRPDVIFMDYDHPPIRL